MTVTRTQYRYLKEIYEVQPVSMQNLTILMGIDTKDLVGQHLRALISKKLIAKTEDSTFFITRLGRFELEKGIPPTSMQQNPIDSELKRRKTLKVIDALLSKDKNKKDWRDLTLLSLTANERLLPHELVSLNIENFNFTDEILKVPSSGALLGVCPRSIKFTKKWVSLLRRKEGPLFVSFDKRSKSNRISAQSTSRLISSLCDKVPETKNLKCDKCNELTKDFFYFKGELLCEFCLLPYREIPMPLRTQSPIGFCLDF